jgi:antitoxin PrlF
MAHLHEVATITSKGQITLPKPIRQALGLEVGGKIAFDLSGSQIVVKKAEEEHRDPAITGFLRLLEKDIKAGQRVSHVPDKLAQSMKAALKRQVNLAEDIEGDVAL